MPIELHPCQIPLEKGAIIWRYMDINKYISLLETSSLFFCRSDKFSDPFEGSIPRREAEYRIKEAKKGAEFHKRPFDEEKAWLNIRGLQSLHVRFKKGIIVNCWHINNDESDAMWRLYLKDNEGVAIQSTVERMQLTMEKAEEKIELSKIRYLNYEQDIWFHAEEYPITSYNLITPFMHKRREFVHEQEYRLYHQIQEAIDKPDYWDGQKNPHGKFIKVDLQNLIERIYLPPTVEEKTTKRIVELTKSSGYDFEFKVSKLKSEPYY